MNRDITGWTSAEIERLRTLAQQGLTSTIIAERLARSTGSIRKKASQIGLRFSNSRSDRRVSDRIPFIALITAHDAPAHPKNRHPLEAALRREGAVVYDIDWNDTETHWYAFDIAFLCFTWKKDRPSAAFLRWATRVSRLTPLIQPLHFTLFDPKDPSHDCRFAPNERARTASAFPRTPDAIDLCVATLLGRCTILPRTHDVRDP